MPWKKKSTRKPWNWFYGAREAPRERTDRALKTAVKREVDHTRSGARERHRRLDEALGEAIDERNRWEDHITAIARELGITSEWSNNHELGEEALKRARNLVVARGPQT